jgi:hypothetical protein
VIRIRIRSAMITAKPMMNTITVAVHILAKHPAEFGKNSSIYRRRLTNMGKF